MKSSIALLPFVLALSLPSCTSSPQSELSLAARAALINETHSSDERSLTPTEAQELVRVLPTANERTWSGEGSLGEGPGTSYEKGLKFVGTWKGGRLEGPFVGFHRGLLLVEGQAKNGVVVDGTLFQHVVFQPLFSGSWSAEHTQFIQDQGGTHSLMAFSGLFEDGVPHRGRFGIADDAYRNYRVTSYIEGSQDSNGLWQGTFAEHELGSVEYDNIEPADEEYGLVQTGKMVDGVREGHWMGPKLDSNFKNGKRQGYCRERIRSTAADGEFCSAWITANYDQDVPRGVIRLAIEDTSIEYHEYTPGPNPDATTSAGWNLVQPREGAPYMALSDRGGRFQDATRRDLPAGTTLASLKARAQWLELGNGVTWNGGVKDGKPHGFGRRYGNHAFTAFEEGWFEDGEPSGFTVGISYRDNADHHPRFFYVWNDGTELTGADGLGVYRAEELADLDAMMAEIQSEMRQLSLRMRPEEEQVWYAVAWEGKVFNPEGHEVPPVMKPAAELAHRDIVWEKGLGQDGTSRAFVVVRSLETSELGWTRVKYFGVDEVGLHSRDDLLTTFRRQDTGSLFDDVLEMCQVCGGESTEVYLDSRQYETKRREYNPALAEMLEVTYLVTEHFESSRTCTNCAGRGFFPNWGLGN